VRDFNDFDRRFRDGERRFNLIFRLALLGIAIAFTFQMAIYFLAAKTVLNLVGEVSQTGLKSFIDRIWEGPGLKDR
jgi:hypothetical protein